MLYEQKRSKMRSILCAVFLGMASLGLIACGESSGVNETDLASDLLSITDTNNVGIEGGPCYGNETCGDGLVCTLDVCARIGDGHEGGPCYGNGTCDTGLDCVEGICWQKLDECSESIDCEAAGDGFICEEGQCVLDPDYSPGPSQQAQSEWDSIGESGGTSAFGLGEEIDSFCSIPNYSNGNNGGTCCWGGLHGSSPYGYKWQCTEFAFRFICQHYDSILGCAASGKTQKYGNAWEWYDNIYNNPVLGLLERYPNNATTSPPRPGDLLIFDRTTSNSYGHVAVVRDVAADYVAVIEQNVASTSRDGFHAHTLYETNGVYRVTGALGWLRVPGGSPACGTAGQCPDGNGLYCGEAVGLVSGQLYRCTDGSFAAEENCPVASEQIPSQDDRCTCTDDCTPGVVCAGDSSYHECRIASDGCYRYGFPFSCGMGEHCTDGVCYACVPDWSCTAWSSCSGGAQARTCTDSNSCGTTTGQPATSQSCTCGNGEACCAGNQCDGGLQCQAGYCGCVPDCTGKCGGAPNGCGSTCTASCSSGQVCSGQICTACGGSGQACCSGSQCDGSLQCQAGFCGCVPSCAGKCGGAADGCGSTCTASCPSGQVCSAQSCAACGGSGQVCCSGSQCDGSLQCQAGFCGCVPNCTGKCGGAPDGCGSTCTASCSSGQACSGQSCIACGGSGQVCCAGSQCDGGLQCQGGTCGSCLPSWTCTDWSSCLSGQENRSCADSNGCGTSSGKPAETRLCPLRTKMRRLFGGNGGGCGNPTANWDHCPTTNGSTCLALNQAHIFS